MSSESLPAVAGVDVSAKTLDASVLLDGGDKRKRKQFGNTPEGHVALIAWLISCKVVRVVCEATGVYHLDLAFAIVAAKLPLMVANPRPINRFIEACGRNFQTDASDADKIAEFARRMHFVPWKAPSDKAFAVHKLGRAVGQLTKRHAAMLNRLHAAKATAHTPKSIVSSFEREIRFLERERAKISADAAKIIAADAELARKFELLVSVPGIAEVSALAILAEVIVLPPDLAGKAWVKYAGLDPMKKTSGTSVNTKTRIAKRGNAKLRGALYWPAMTARTHDPHMYDFVERMVTKHKKPLEAIVGVQRKLLLGIHAMFRTNQTWNSQSPKARENA